MRGEVCITGWGWEELMQRETVCIKPKRLSGVGSLEVGERLDSLVGCVEESVEGEVGGGWRDIGEGCDRVHLIGGGGWGCCGGGSCGK